MRKLLITLGAGMAGGCAVLAGSGCSGGIIFQEQVVRTDDLLAVPGPFRPSVMRVHPLTHAELDAQGQPVLILHMELKDPWGDTVKGVGQLQAQLRRVGGNTGGTLGDRGTRWDVDLRDIEKNVSYFDSATRTYRIVLGGLPVWMNAMTGDEDSSDVRVRVLFRTAKADGEAVVLQDEYLLR